MLNEQLKADTEEVGTERHLTLRCFIKLEMFHQTSIVIMSRVPESHLSIKFY